MSDNFVKDTLIPFVSTELALLKAYDAQRPAGHPYEFDLHSARVAEDMKRLALVMNMPAAKADILYQLTLVHDIGKRLLPVSIWDIEGKPDEKMKAQRLRHTQLGVDIVDENFGYEPHPVLDLMRDMMAHHHDKVHNDMSQETRMLCICDAFDGYSVRRPHFGERDVSPEAVLYRMSVEKAGQYDPIILKIFADIKLQNPSPAPSGQPKRSVKHAKL